jgi:aspartate racemase
LLRAAVINCGLLKYKEVLYMKKSLGVLGGMGPQATADFLRKVVTMTDAKTEPDHIRVYADIHPQIPDRLQAILHGGESPVGAIVESLKKLEACGAQVIVMPCNTAHYFYDEFIEHVSEGVEFVNILNCVSDACEAGYSGKTAGILSTAATKASCIVKNELDKKGITYIEMNDEQQDKMTGLIYRVKMNDDMEITIAAFKEIIEEMRNSGAEYFVLACTEIPVIVDAYDFPYPVVDSTLELAKAAVLKCGYNLR